MLVKGATGNDRSQSAIYWLLSVTRDEILIHGWSFCWPLYFGSVYSITGWRLTFILIPEQMVYILHFPDTQSIRQFYGAVDWLAQYLAVKWVAQFSTPQLFKGHSAINAKLLAAIYRRIYLNITLYRFWYNVTKLSTGMYRKWALNKIGWPVHHHVISHESVYRVNGTLGGESSSVDISMKQNTRG